MPPGLRQSQFYEQENGFLERVLEPIISVLVISHDVVGSRMAGPGIRYWELAHVLGRYFKVTLAVPRETDLSSGDVQLWTYEPDQWDSLAPAIERASTILLCGDTLACFPMLEQADIPLIVDGYDPHPLETLEMFAGAPDQEQRHRERERILQMQCRAGDFFICASERQRDWWLGLLEAAGRINVHTHGQDPSLRRLADIVPFGLPSSLPRHTQRVLKGVWPGIELEDKVVLWGGGLWQWLDPLTAIRAIDRVRKQRADVKLVFPGTRHPNAGVPDMPMLQAASRLAEKLGLLNQQVFFGDWVPYEEWPAYLLEADIGLALHFDTIETRLAFRSRILDYVWAGLPMVVTRGDATSDLVARLGVGEVVDYEADNELVTALLRLLDAQTPDLDVRFERARAELTWERAAIPLVAFCQHPCRAPDKIDGNSAPPPTAWQWWKLAAQRGVELDNLRAVTARRDAEIARLQKLVTGYEQGRFIRLTRWLYKTWHSILKSRYAVPWLDRMRTEGFYRQLIREVGQASNHAFVDRAYWRVLGRAPDVAGFMYYTDLLARGQCSRRRVVTNLVQSTEFRTQPRPVYGLPETLHLTRCKLISQLPPADHVLDLGGAAPNSVQGALFVMGYPHRVRSLTIVDLPPEDRLGNYECGDSEKPGRWIDTEMGAIRHLHTLMTDLSIIESSSVNLVFSGQSIEHVNEEDGQYVMQEAFRMLRPGGHFCLDTPNGALARIQSPDAFLHPEHKVEYRVDDLAARLRDVGFEIKEIKGICPMPRTVQTGIFDEQELLSNSCLSDDAEICYLFYIRCVKPD